MNRRITLTARALILFSVIVATTVPFSCAVEWSPDQRLTTHNANDWNPSITSTTSGEVWVVWRSNRTGNLDLYYKIFDGSIWSEEMQLTTDTHEDAHPSIMQANDGKIWVVWDSDRNEISSDLYYKVFDGSTWSGEIQLTTDPLADGYPSIMQASNGKIWVVWVSNRVDLQANLFYKFFDGSSWSNDTRITTDVDVDYFFPSVMQASDGTIWVAFCKITYGSKGQPQQDIYYKQYNGTAWSVDVRLTFDITQCDTHPSIMQALDGSIWVVWDSYRNAHDENIYYKVFDGVWSPDTKLTTHLSADIWPSITQTINQAIWIAWGSIRLNNVDIYYKTGLPPPNHDVAIINVETSTNTAIRGETISIQVTAQNQGTYTETFEVKCYVNSTLVGSTTISLSAGQTKKMYPFSWNTTGALRGIYVISATASAVPGETDFVDNYRETAEPVEVRIKGDICGMYNGRLSPIPDGVVDINDFMAASMPGHLYTQEPDWDPVWGPACDVNNDGRVGIMDLMIIGIHIGET